MASPRSSQRAELTRLRETMLERGAAMDEVATEVRARFRYGVRAAYRHAAGLTLDQAAERYNGAAGDAEARTTGPRISEWESWPQGGRRPTAFNLITLAHVFGTDPARLIIIDEERYWMSASGACYASSGQHGGNHRRSKSRRHAR